MQPFTPSSREGAVFKPEVVPGAAKDFSGSLPPRDHPPPDLPPGFLENDDSAGWCCFEFSAYRGGKPNWSGTFAVLCTQCSDFVAISKEICEVIEVLRLIGTSLRYPDSCSIRFKTSIYKAAIGRSDAASSYSSCRHPTDCKPRN